MMKKLMAVASLLTLAISASTSAASFTLSSNDIKQGEFMSQVHEFKGFGCTGDDLSPHLKWENAPKGTKSFAITAYDPDAPTGSGWWHWQVVNIDKSTTEIAQGAGSEGHAAWLSTASHVDNDYGNPRFGGACPPQGHGVHRYQFTVHALSVEKLELPANASGALAGYMINANSLASSTIEALYQRD